MFPHPFRHLPERARKAVDRGASTAELAGLVALAVGVAAVLAAAGVPAAVEGAARRALCPLLQLGRCQTDRTAAPIPVLPALRQPGHPCYSTLDINYFEITGTLPTRRLVDLRGSSRIGVQTRKVVRPGQAPQWQVQLYGWGEGALATPGLPSAQMEADDPLGVFQPGQVSKLPMGAWFGGNSTRAAVYAFDKEKDAREFPATVLRWIAGSSADVSMKANPVFGPVYGIATSLPGVGGSLRRAVTGPPLPRPYEWSEEDGLTGGFTAKHDLFSNSMAKLGLSVGGRGWHLTGTRVNDKGETTITVRTSGEVEPSVVVDLGRLVGPNVRRRSYAGVDALVTRLEEAGRSKLGAPFRIPAELRDRLTKNWPDAGLTLKAKGNATYQVTFDKNGQAVRFTKLVDSQVNLYGRLSDKVATKDRAWEGAGNIQTPYPWSLLDVGNARTLDQSSLDLGDRENREAVAAFLQNAAWSGAGAELGPAADRLDRLFESKGTKTQLNYRSLVTNGKLSGEHKSRRGLGLLELKGESEGNVLTDARVWQPGRGWVPWTGCAP